MVDWNKIDESQKKLVTAAARRSASKPSTPTPAKKKSPSFSERLDRISRGPNAGPKKPSGPSIFDKAASKLDKISRGPNATPKDKESTKEDANPNDETEGERYAKSLEKKATSKVKASIKKAADRQTTAKSLQRIQNTPGAERENLEAKRRERIKTKDYKGKYYGPDAFKGNLDTLRKWRAAGSPSDTKSFAKKK